MAMMTRAVNAWKGLSEGQQAAVMIGTMAGGGIGNVAGLLHGHAVNKRSNDGFLRRAGRLYQDGAGGSVLGYGAGAGLAIGGVYGMSKLAKFRNGVTPMSKAAVAGGKVIEGIL